MLNLAGVHAACAVPWELDPPLAMRTRPPCRPERAIPQGAGKLAPALREPCCSRWTIAVALFDLISGGTSRTASCGQRGHRCGAARTEVRHAAFGAMPRIARLSLGCRERLLVAARKQR